MCNEYARRRTLQRFAEDFSAAALPAFIWRDGLTPNDLNGTASVRIGDSAPIVRLGEGGLVGEMMTWAWKGAHGKPVFNFVSEACDFSRSDRVLVFADGFYEFTTPAAPKVKLKDKHIFKLKRLALVLDRRRRQGERLQPADHSARTGPCALSRSPDRPPAAR